MELIAASCWRCGRGLSARSARFAGITSPSVRLQSSESDDTKRPKRPVSERGQESHGAMKNYFQQSSASGDGAGANPWGEMIGSVKATSGRPSSIAGPDFSPRSTGRSFNKRTVGKKNRGPVGPSGVGGAAGKFEQPSGMAKVFGRRADGFDEEAGNKDDDGSIPQEMLPYLFDTPFFEEKQQQGMEMDFGDMDPIDKFFADAFMQSLKHNKHEVTYHLADDAMNRIRLPKPRPTRDLIQSLIPDITSVTRAEDPEAYQIGADAWLAISKNVHFSDEEKSYICNKIAKGAQMLNAGAIELEKSGELDKYRIFSPDFHKGYDGLTPEQRREIFGSEEVEDQEMEEIIKYVDGEDLTDYDVEAVVDEDQLFN